MSFGRAGCEEVRPGLLNALAVSEAWTINIVASRMGRQAYTMSLCAQAHILHSTRVPIYVIYVRVRTDVLLRDVQDRQGDSTTTLGAGSNPALLRAIGHSYRYPSGLRAVNPSGTTYIELSAISMWWSLRCLHDQCHLTRSKFKHIAHTDLRTPSSRILPRRWNDASTRGDRKDGASMQFYSSWRSRRESSGRNEIHTI